MMRLTTQTCPRPRGGLVPARGGGRGQVVRKARPKKVADVEASQ